MKDKRNCNNNMNYPIYPNFQTPMMIPPVGYQNYIPYNNTPSNGFEQQLNSLEQQITQLEQRITRLEKLNMNNTNYNKYNDSNYYMV